MKSIQNLTSAASIRAILLVLSGIAVNLAEGSQSTGTEILLRVTGGSVSADIRGARLADVAHALERKIGARIHFAAPWMERQVIYARFDDLTPKSAVQTLLEGSSYALVAGSESGGDGIQVYLCSGPLPDAAGPVVALSRSTEHDDMLDPEPKTTTAPPLDPRDLPTPIDDADPEVRVQELQAAVASQGPQSLPLVLAGIQDSDSSVRSASEQILLDDLRNSVPKEILSKMVLTSEHADVRQQAMEVMAADLNNPEYSRITLDSALRDTVPAVRQRAEELLEQLSAP